MSRMRISRWLLAGGALFILAAGAIYIMKPRIAEHHARNLLRDAGFTLEAWTQVSPAQYANIKLDPQGDSMIGSLIVKSDWPYSILKGRSPRTDIIASNAIFSADLTSSGFLKIIGWEPSRRFEGFSTDSLSLESGQLDIATPAGAIRVEAKGLMTRQENGDQKIQTALWGKQSQLGFSAQGDMILKPDKSWSASIDIEDARLNLNTITASRISGWITLDDSYALGAQLTAGQIKIGENTTFGNMHLTADGTPATMALIIKATAGAVNITADIRNEPDGAQINAFLESNNVESLLRFLSALNQDLQTMGSPLASLLLTKGNLERVKKEISKLDYDVLELVIDGRPNDLTGKILAKKLRDGVYQSQVVSLNPAGR